MSLSSYNMMKTEEFENAGLASHQVNFLPNDLILTDSNLKHLQTN